MTRFRAKVDANHREIVEANSQRTPAKVAAARRNLVLAMEANKARHVPTYFTCKRCGVQKRCKPREKRLGIKVYCSMRCMSDDYRDRLRGDSNPNYSQSAGRRRCQQCGIEFHNYNKSRKFCSMDCRDAAQRYAMRYRTHRVDSNQKEIVQALKSVGASVLDTSDVGGGMPDLVVGHNGENFLLEVKNPNNEYGKRGLTKRQKSWADAWCGGPVNVVFTAADALKVIGVLV